MQDILLEIKNLKVRFYSEGRITASIDDINMFVRRGETLGIVGESGCGKSVTAMSVLRLIPNPPGKIEGGEILFEEKDLLKLNLAEMQRIRGKDISMIFQEPMTSLNPVFTVGKQIVETIMTHQKIEKSKAREEAIRMLKLVGIPSPERRVDDYPHQMSGGMRQRVMIAMALSCRPHLLIADEPTTALDVTIQAQILDLMRSMKDEFGMSIMFITHDLGVIAEMAERVVVMYAGRVVEEAPVRELFASPLHPYTKGLLSSLPKIGFRERLTVIPGIVPEFSNLPKGCPFSPRCAEKTALCEEAPPRLCEVSEGRRVSCHLYGGEEADEI